jgi:hypothetical protein
MEDEKQNSLASSSVIRCVELAIDDCYATQQAAAPRQEGDYLPGKLYHASYTLPVNVQRSLMNHDSLERLRGVVTEAAVPDFRLAIIQHRINSYEDESTSYFVPLHLATIFTQQVAGTLQQVRVAGPIFVSTLHNVLSSRNIKLEDKIETTESILGEYLNNASMYDVTVIAMPRKRYKEHSFTVNAETSLTHTLLLRACASLQHYRELEQSGVYLMAHASAENLRRRDELLESKDFWKVIKKITRAWAVNLQSVTEQPVGEEKWLAEMQKEEMLKLLVESCRKKNAK